MVTCNNSNRNTSKPQRHWFKETLSNKLAMKCHDLRITVWKNIFTFFVN